MWNTHLWKGIERPGAEKEGGGIRIGGGNDSKGGRAGGEKSRDDALRI